MMFLAENKLSNIVRKQFYFKAKGLLGLFSTMIALQILAVLLSLRGTGQMGMSSSFIKVSVKYLSNDLVLFFTAGWACYAAIMLTTKTYRNIDFTFVSNRVSSSLANFAFLAAASILGGLTSVLLGILLRVINYFSVGSSSIIGQEFFVSPGEMLVGIAAAALYILLLSAVGYLAGMMVQVYQLFSPLIVALIWGVLIIEGRSGGSINIMQRITGFIIREDSFIIFAAKVIVIVLILFGGAISISNRLEVRKP